MYLPPSFEVADQARIHAVIRENGFATLVASADGKPFVSHVPLLLDAARGPQGTLRGHVARANPHADLLIAGAPMLAIFQGPHGYVSPTWYRDRTRNVPTWNYVAVHAQGIPRIVDQPEAVDGLLDGLAAAYEGGDKPWRIGELAEGQRAAMRKAIVCFDLPIDRLEAKFKLSQNKPEPDRLGVIAVLRQAGDPDSLALATAMTASAVTDGAA